jgi:hypothetical protein
VEDNAREAAQQIVEVNKKRKLTHQAVGEQLQGIEAEWASLIVKNREIETASNVADRKAQILQQKLDK